MSLMEGSGKYLASTTKYSCQKKTNKTNGILTQRLQETGERRQRSKFINTLRSQLNPEVGHSKRQVTWSLCLKKIK